MPDPRRCECGRSLPEPGPGGGRRRKWCEVCRPSETKPSEAPKGRASVLAVSVWTPQAGAEPVEGAIVPESVYSATLAQLASVGREHTAAGAAALVLARQLDANVATAPSVANALLKALDVAIAGAQPAADWLDDLEQRRRRKASGA
jgi:hypothetical protein